MPAMRSAGPSGRPTGPISAIPVMFRLGTAQYLPAVLTGVTERRRLSWWAGSAASPRAAPARAGTLTGSGPCVRRAAARAWQDGHAGSAGREVAVSKRVVIVGGGFGRMYTARQLERRLPRGSAEIVLVNPENFMLYTPLLPEAAAGV